MCIRSTADRLGRRRPGIDAGPAPTPPAASLCGLLILAVGLLGVPVRTAAQPDPFLEAHAASSRSSAGPYRFTIRFAGGRTVFTAGEPMGLELVFDPPGVSPDIRESPCGGWMLADAVIDPSEAVLQPGPALCANLAERPRAGVLGCGFGGGLVGRDGIRVESPPLVLPVVLNGPYHLTRPGRYRLFVRSRHADADPARPRILTSNVLSFEVRPSEPAEVVRRVAAAVAQLDRELQAEGPARLVSPCGGETSAVARRAPGQLSAEAIAALHVLRAAGTSEVAYALAARYRSTPGESSGPVDEWLLALHAVRDCRTAVDALDREVRDPDRAIDGFFLRDLAALAATCSSKRGRPDLQTEYLRLVEHYGVLRASVLAGRSGRLESAIRADLAGAARRRRFLRGALGAVLGRYPVETMAAFRALSPGEQTNLLRVSWRRFAHPAFLPLVRALYHEATDDQLRDIALRRWFQLAPVEGRPAMLAELARPEPRVTVTTLAQLPDRALPRLERAWVDLLEHASSEAVFVTAAGRLSRFGTRASAARAARVLSARLEDLPPSASAAVLGFLARVDGRRVRRLLSDAVWTRAVPPSLIAAHGWTREVEAVTVRALQHPSRVMVVDAARTLATHASAAARPALEAALEGVRRTAPTTPLIVYKVWRDEDIEGEFAEALGHASGWWLTPDERTRLLRACIGHACRQALELDVSVDPAHVVLVFDPDEDDPAARMYFDGLHVRSSDALVRKLQQLPRGTRVYWRDQASFDPALEQWTLAERDRLRRRIQIRVADAGIALVRERRVVRRD